ncbi:hypothetical protein [Pedobacter punctiformis]|uniref:Uncharacterized protein n=1 Tax=Pedobacter punctiformis TaxID=3004097 RepID=A0ABT4LB54_9SPHI|nr:hypothetical protein [Pedobacter sp. HCMS5-2]MCZ4245143.1 hypothetical protein [Pedobacter sp. HCMS5-2]
MCIVLLVVEKEGTYTGNNMQDKERNNDIINAEFDNEILELIAQIVVEYLLENKEGR